jgi:hypothetical protein
MERRAKRFGECPLALAKDKSRRVIAAAVDARRTQHAADVS